MSEIQTQAEDIPVPFDPIIPAFREWAQLKFRVTEMTSRMNKLRDKVSEAVEARGYTDHKGSMFLDLPFGIPAGDGEYVKIKRERRVTVSPDQEAAERITRSKGEHIFNRAFPPVPTLDVEELYRLLQEDILTDDDMDSIFVRHITYAFKGLTR